MFFIGTQCNISSSGNNTLSQKTILTFLTVTWKPIILHICDVFVFSKLKNRQICSYHWTSKSWKCFSFRGALPAWPLWPGSLPLDSTMSFWSAQYTAQQVNKVDIWPTQEILLPLLCPGSCLLPFCPQLQIPSAVHVCWCSWLIVCLIMLVVCVYNAA